VADQQLPSLRAYPTKDLFISTLVRDIPLGRAILDLIDNCVDGAKRTRDVENFDGLWVELTINRDRFIIADNCGGMDLKLAQNYAFRFGHPEGMPKTHHSVGHFGVGMKRALFKLGNAFTVESRSRRSFFSVSVNVEEWKQQRDENGNDDWSFKNVRAEEFETDTPDGDRGTKITVTPLHSSVADEFGSELFQTSLYREIQMAQQFSLQRGLRIRINGLETTSRPLCLAYSEIIKPAFLKFSVNGVEPRVDVEIFAGVTNEERTEFAEAGWYVFCNQRLILPADQTEDTGWTFHPTFNRFRGYVFFDCDDAGRLPWNTMKTGVDVNAGVYKAVRLQMISTMAPILSFLKRFAKEATAGVEEEPLHVALAETEMRELSQLEEVREFVYPDLQETARIRPRYQWIKYQKPKVEIDRAKEKLKVTTSADVGEASFDYFYKHECSD
jgi:Histidine kinase-, DNA gyrase B-, and HSP90-like ATPase